GDICELLTGDLPLLEVVKIIARAVSAARGRNRVDSLAAGLDVPRGQHFLDEVRTRPHVRERVAAIAGCNRSRNRRAVRPIERAAAVAVLVQFDRDPTQPRVIGTETIARDVGLLVAADRDLLEVPEIVTRENGPAAAVNGVI